MSATKVKLRKRTLPSGKITLYLDFYPPVRNPKTLELSRREYLAIYLKSNPRTLQDREDNAEKIRIAEGIRATREISILNHQFGFIDRSTPKMDFLAWYRSQVENNNKNWAFAYNYFYQYVDGKCTMGDITIELCKGFREYLLSAKLIKNQKKALNQNSASGYWSTFRALLAIAYREHLIKENVNDYLEAISDVEIRREYLTLEELRDLADTETTLPISAEALELCGKRDKGLDRQMTRQPLKDWLEDAGIGKHITFHCFRHINATLLLDSGADIYTVSKMLTHRNVATTQIYIKVMDKNKRKAAESLTIKKK